MNKDESSTEALPKEADKVGEPEGTKEKTEAASSSEASETPQPPKPLSETLQETQSELNLVSDLKDETELNLKEVRTQLDSTGTEAPGLDISKERIRTLAEREDRIQLEMARRIDFREKEDILEFDPDRPRQANELIRTYQFGGPLEGLDAQADKLYRALDKKVLGSKGRYNELISTQELGTAVEARAESKKIEGATIYTKLKLALHEADAIIRGYLEPNQKRESLRSTEVFLSYSRRNEELAKAVHLILRRDGLSVYFDKQEGNPSIPSEMPKWSGPTRGIGFGYNWGLSLKKGVPEDGYGIVLLTHEVLDKFDVIGGTEIPELVDKHNKLLLITLDNNPEISVMDRLRQMHAKGGEYAPAYEALLSPDAQVMALGAEDLDPDKLSDKIIDKLAEGETDQTDIAHDENKKAKMAHQDYLAARDATLIVYGITKPEQIVSQDLRWDKFSLSPLFQNLPESGPMLGNLRKSFENFGMHSSEKAGNDAYIIFPVTTEFLTSDINQLQAAGITPQDLDRSTTWPLFFSSSEEDFSAIHEQLNIISKDEGHVLNSFAKRMLETQGVIASLKDLEDPGAFASYLIMKQGLVEAAEKDARAKLLKGEKT